jgi:hypothetical protein
MATIQSFTPAITSGEVPSGSAAPWVHAVVDGASFCRREAPLGWTGQSRAPVYDWLQVTCPHCLAAMTQSARRVCGPDRPSDGMLSVKDAT